MPRTLTLATIIPPSLRSGHVSLDETEHFLRQRRYAPAVFGFIPELPFGSPPEYAFSFAGIPK